LFYEDNNNLNFNRTGKLSFFGIGPKMAIVLLPWLFATIIISSSNTKLFIYTGGDKTFLLIAGVAMMATGLFFYFSTIRLLLKGLKETILLKKGAYKLCQNPLYSSIMICIIPALSLLLNSWLVFTSSIVGFILFKIFIRNEYKELEKLFGEEYLIYKKNTPEFFPIPLKKWLT
jgi:protein-S-isoprenylcysteine O-methyltransferase Ste14